MCLEEQLQTTCQNENGRILEELAFELCAAADFAGWQRRKMYLFA